MDGLHDDRCGTKRGSKCNCPSAAFSASGSNELLCVVAAAIKDHDGDVYQLPKPARHHNIIKLMADKGIKTPITGEQGFVLSDNRFVSRVIAKIVAVDAEQLLPRASTGVELFSECVW